jgi:methyl-accepting chemotaxis protein
MQKKMVLIELGIADDIKKVVSESNAMLGDLDSKFAAMERTDAAFKTVGAAADKAAADATKSVSAANKLQTKVATILEKADKAAKDLGVAPTSVSGYNEADKIYNDLELKIKKVNAFDFPIAAQIAKGL